MRTNKEILAVVNQMVSDGQIAQDIAEKYFPELRESKDELMMKIIMNALIKVPYSELDGLIPDTIRIWLEEKIKQGEQEPAEWSEEDEERIKNILSVLDVQVCWDGATGKKGNPYQKEINWLKSLRPQNWTKEDKERYISCLQRLGTGNPGQPETINSKWFKEHVYPQKKWKPSEEQMEYLAKAITTLGNEGDNKTSAILYELWTDLKKLKE